MNLALAIVPPTFLSPYGPRGALVPLPKRMRLLHPAACTSLDGAHDWLVLTDCFRSLASSLAARAAKRGVQKPGWSAHNFGLAIDVDVRRTLKRMRAEAGGGAFFKATLDKEMESRGWYCYRADHKLDAPESWHMSWSARGPGSAAVEDVIQRYYGEYLALDKKQVQRTLAALGLYRGEFDGKHGPQTKAAVAAFQRTWSLAPDGVAGPETQRLLAVAEAHTRVRVPVSS